MEKNFNVSNPHFSPFSSNATTKTLRLVTDSTKSLKQNGVQADPLLTTWYEQASAYYNAVLSGDEAQPDPKKWQNFLNQMQWASGELGYGQSNWDPAMGSQQGPGPQGQQRQQLPAGASVGAMDNIVWNSAKADINYAGGNQVNDIWSNEVNLNVSSLSANVTSEITQDTRMQPPEEVIKITVKDPATQAETVYFVHDYQDAKIKIRTPVQKQVTDSTDSVGVDLVGWEEFKATGTPGKGGASHPDASVEGEVTSDDIHGSTTKYAPEFYDETSTIDLFANPNEPGKTDTSVISYSNANISAKADDDVVIVKDVPNAGDVTVKVIHNKGTDKQSEDDYVVKKGYKTVNINGNPASIHFDSETGAAGTDGVPTEYTGVTLNGAAAKPDPKKDKADADADADLVISGLMKAGGLTDPEQLFSALQLANYPYKDKESLKAAIESGEFPPAKPDDQLLSFMKILDPTFKNALNKAFNGGGKTAANTAVTRAETMLKALYPHTIVAKSIDENADGFDDSITVGDAVVLSFHEKKLGN